MRIVTRYLHEQINPFLWFSIRSSYALIFGFWVLVVLLMGFFRFLSLLIRTPKNGPWTALSEEVSEGWTRSVTYSRYEIQSNLSTGWFEKLILKLKLIFLRDFRSWDYRSASASACIILTCTVHYSVGYSWSNAKQSKLSQVKSSQIYQYFVRLFFFFVGNCENVIRSVLYSSNERYVPSLHLGV